MSKRRGWVVAFLAALAAGVIVLAVVFDWNWVKQPLEDQVSAALGREFAIAGDLDVDLSTTPVITLEQVRIANAEWGSRPDMLTVARVEFALDLWRLLDGEIVLPFARVAQPDLLLEANPEGQANWQFGARDESDGPPAIPVIRDLEVTEAAIAYREPGAPGDVVAALEKIEGAIRDDAPGVDLSVDGTVGQQPLSLSLTAAPLDQLADSTRRYPFQLAGRLGAARLDVIGSAEDPLRAEGLSAEIALESEDPATLLTLIGMAPREIAPLALDLSVTATDQVWSVPEMTLRLGETDLSGTLALDVGGDEPAIMADLRSDQIRLGDLQGLIDLARKGADQPPEKQAIEQALADAKVQLEAQEGDATEAGLRPSMLPAVDAEISYAVGSFIGPEFSLQDLEVYGRLEDRLPRLTLTGSGSFRDAPVDIDVKVGPGDQVASDQRAYPIDASIRAAATEIQVAGEIGKPDTLDGVDLEVRIESRDPNELLALADADLPEIPPFLITGHVVQAGQVWRIADFYGQFRDSDLEGLIELDLSDRRPFIAADLRSNRLLASDLMAAADKGTAIEDRLDETPSAEEGPAVISMQGVNFEALPEIDADVSFQADFVEVPEFQFDRVSFDLKLRDQIAILDASGDGDFRNGRITFDARAGTEQNLGNPDARYPVRLEIETSKTLVAIEGTVTKPGQAAGLDVDVALEGPNLDRLGEILQLSLPTTPPFELRSHLAHDANRWTLTDLSGTIGDSDVQGDATIVLGGERPTLEAELTSKKLDFDDLGLLVGAPTGAGGDETLSARQERAAAEEAATKGVLPDEPFDVPELRAVDARVSYRAERVEAPNLPLEGVAIDLVLEDGRLRLEPLRFDLAGGHLDSVIRLDGREETLAGELQLDIRQIRLGRLLSGFDIEIEGIEMEREGVGTLTGRAQLAVRGNSIQAIAGSAAGDFAIIVDGGKLNALIVEAIGLDIGELAALLLTGDEEAQSEMVDLQCFVARFEAEDGVMRSEALVLETSDSTITGKGQVDLGQETLAIELLAHPKDPSALAASTPVRIEGTFEDPGVELISEELKEKSLGALALGLVMPVVGALLPFIEGGETKDTNCARLIADASAAAPASDAPERQPSASP